MKPTPDFIRDPRQMRGSNHNGMRQFNERIVLQAIRHQGAIAKADLARLTQLSTQTVSIIVDRLLGDDLLLKQDRVRGKIGQPSVPLSLNPDGAFSIGLQVGRRSLEVLACDFVGQVRHRLQYHYPFPDPDVVLPYIEKGLSEIQALLGPHWERAIGVGMAAPLSLHRWGDLMGDATRSALARWEHLDLPTTVRAMTPLPVDFAKDTTAACLAEMLQGQGRAVESFLYVFVGTFVGGGLVIAGHLMAGQRNNAGAIGSMPTAMALEPNPPTQPPQRPAQLLQLASGWPLEQTLQRAGHDPQCVHDDRIMEPIYAAWVQPWLAQASEALAMTALSAAALMDLDAVVMDGSLGRSLIEALIGQTRQRLNHYHLDGLQAPAVVAGSVGPHARALGGALLPLHTQFFPLKDIFLKEDTA